MIHRTRGAKAGIKDYLQKGTGKKHGRNYWDERKVLHGDLDITDTIIQNRESKGDKYLHYTMSFAEDYVPDSVLESVEKDMREFLGSAFREDELNFYTEAHIPKIKESVDRVSGAKKIRKPHTHTVIPKTNLITNEYENPFGLYKMNEKYFDAFQRVTNGKYGLQNPKANNRHTNQSEVVSSYIRLDEKLKGDKNSQASKKSLLEKVVEQDMDYEALKAYLQEYAEEFKIRNEGKHNEYLYFKEEGQTRGINLKDSFFMRAFMNKPLNEKLEKIEIQKKEDENYIEVGEPYEVDEKYHKLVDEWKEIHSKFVRFVAKKGKDEKAELSQLYKDPEKRKEIVEKLEKEYYEKQKIHFDGFSLDRDESIDDLEREIDKTEFEKNPTVATVVHTAIKELLRIFNLSSRDVRKLDKTVDKKALLEHLQKENGLNSKHIQITGDKFQIGKRRMTPSQFLSREMRYEKSDMDEALVKFQKQEQEIERGR